MVHHLNSHEIIVTAEDSDGPILTAQVNPYRDTSIGGPQPMYRRGKPIPLVLCCESPLASDPMPADTQKWTLAVSNYDPVGGAIFDTRVDVNIATQRTVEIVVTPGGAVRK